jgi:hypothetical protein
VISNDTIASWAAARTDTVTTARLTPSRPSTATMAATPFGATSTTANIGPTEIAPSPMARMMADRAFHTVPGSVPVAPGDRVAAGAPGLASPGDSISDTVGFAVERRAAGPARNTLGGSWRTVTESQK